ncbi:MAG: DUF89 family protein [Phycisphaerae bacterium]|nr:DUF89 family protein [Phycisphaerae bacterium]
MAVLPLLANPAGYQACDWDLSNDPAGREHWMDEFRKHADSMLAYAAARRNPPTVEQMAAMRRAFFAELDHLRHQPTARGRLDVLSLCSLRDRLLLEFDIGDPYVDVKAAENRAALVLYPDVVRRLDDVPADRRVEALLVGMVAGNRFDLGSPVTAQEYAASGLDFFAELARVKPRPWWRDDVDALAERLGPARPVYRKAILFADNAGADAVLGVLPFARHMASLGVRVVVAATDHFALNDITRADLDRVLAEAAGMDAVLAGQLKSGRLTTVGTGHTHPLIDLADVRDECAAAAADCDLIVLEGMGRAVESNWQAAFRCDSLRVAMIKNVSVARHYGCELFDLVCRLEAGQGRSIEG